MSRSVSFVSVMFVVGLASFVFFHAQPSARADFQEIVPADESDTGFKDVDAKKDAGVKAPTEEELAAAEAARVADAEALRKCAKNYHYSIKKRTLDLRLQQVKLKYDKVVSTTAELFARNPVLGKERRADAQKELDAVTGDLKKLEDGCTGRTPPAAATAPGTGKDAPKDSATDKK